MSAVLTPESRLQFRKPSELASARRERSETNSPVEHAGLAELKGLLRDMERVFSAEPTRWLSGIRGFLRYHDSGIRRHPDSYQPEVREFFKKYGPEFRGFLRALSSKERLGENAERLYEVIGDKAIEALHDASHKFGRDIGCPYEKLDVHLVTWNELIGRSPNLERRDSVVYYKGSHAVPIPQSPFFIQKGGPPRLFAKEHFGAPQRTIDAEVPFNDFDAIVLQGNLAALREAAQLGIEREGIEPVPSLDFEELLGNRDLDINACFLTCDGLVYATAAKEAARNGTTRLLNSDRGIYGQNIFYHEGVVLAKARGLMREMKMVIEEKSLSFDFNERNCHVGMNLYLLVLARRLAVKENGPVLLERLFDLCQQTGQTGGARNVYEMLDASHSKYPFFEIDGPPLTHQGVVKWMAHKFSQYADRTFRRLNDIKVPSDIEIRPGDLTPYAVRLRYSSTSPAHGKDEWQQFVARCNERTEMHLRSKAA